jgi:hypothetical protein
MLLVRSLIASSGYDARREHPTLNRKLRDRVPESWRSAEARRDVVPTVGYSTDRLGDRLCQIGSVARPIRL